MKLSIITINFNDKEGLRQTFESIAAQSFSDFEHIVIDGGSTDGSADLIKEYAHKLSYWVSEPDKGIYNAMNKGIAVAKGEYCYFLNSGDWLRHHDALEKVFAHGFTEEIVYTNCYFCKKPGGPYIEAAFPSERELNFGFFLHDALCHQGEFIKKSLFDRHELYDESLRIFSDYKFVLTAIVHAKASYKYIPEFTAVYNHWGISATNNKLKEQERREILLKDFPFWANDYFKSDQEKYELQAIRNHPLIKTLRRLKKFLRK